MPLSHSWPDGDKRPRERYVGEAKRLLGVRNGRLEGRKWIMGDEYSIADIATFGWGWRFRSGA